MLRTFFTLGYKNFVPKPSQSRSLKRFFLSNSLHHQKISKSYISDESKFLRNVSSSIDPYQSCITTNLIMCCPSLLCAPDWINFSTVIRLKNHQLASCRAVAAIVRCVEHSVGEPLQCQVSILMQKFSFP